ncbi:DNA topoisomerase VI subunit A [Sedimentisphaera cyanobacteriorum]|uniref:Type 2 DNA topoisomerase 6 subunit A n=1 Tax=Sedimentisphaera cyanobacteriorum TaxID=1940790 RepID=A0A1Q2HNM8_9BACT|nr:DNA topoisomerase IV subunit A [Sedimentisphaera cyanobacteriorum]AQQ08855.1 DNA topoisomerase VI subunit A [Sedimentisphaera cyanobacteriorum]
MEENKQQNVAQVIKDSAQDIHDKIVKSQKPTMTTPLRSLSNVAYHEKKGHFQMRGKSKIRTLTVGTVKTFAQTLKMMALSKELIDTDDMATKREAYYISKNWGKAGFDEQSESDTIMDDVEATFKINREKMKFFPEEKGGSVAGRLLVYDRDHEGSRLEIDCTKFGSGAYSIPNAVEELEFKSNADFILAIETAGAFQRLLQYGFWDSKNCILISMGGVPTRACRRFIRRLSESLEIPVYAFVDGDPYGYFNIYRTLKVGSGNAAHLSEFFCVPGAKFLGVTPQDIIDYKLPTHKLKEIDIKRAKDALKNDPFVRHYKQWQKAINQMLKMGVRVEQQAFAKHSLDFVVNEYLPEKLANTNKFLP